MGFVVTYQIEFMVCRCIAVLFLAVFFSTISHGQIRKTENIIIVTLDGLRWQEVFEGADERIISNEKYVDDSQSVKRYRNSSALERRAALMPFLWNIVASKGQLYGNRHRGNKVNCTNHHLISYPGYSEMLVGFRHPKVSSNDKVPNPHATVLEAIQNHRHFEDEVAAFATWDAFPFIFRESKSGIYVNAGKDVAIGKELSQKEAYLNSLQADGHPRADSITFQYALEYLKGKRPRVTFIGLDGTDHYGHRGDYDQYLSAAHRADQMIAELWRWVQSQPDYRDKTTLLITTDHGRGNGRNNGRKHKLLVSGSRHIWFAVIGPDTPAFGEMRIKSKHYQKQVAKTIAAFLGLEYTNKEPVGEVVQTMMSLPSSAVNGPAISSSE